MIGDGAEQEKQQQYPAMYHDLVERYEKLALRCIEAERALQSIEGVTSQEELIERYMHQEYELATVRKDRDQWRGMFERSHEEAQKWKASAEKAAKLVQVPEGAAEADIVKWLQARGYKVSK
jgi:hypothetical protein